MKNEYLDTVLKDAILSSKKEIPLQLKVKLESIPKKYSIRNSYAIILHSVGIISIILFVITNLEAIMNVCTGLLSYLSQLYFFTYYLIESGFLFSLFYILVGIILTWFFSFRKMAF